jgi:hypothetical protein
VSKEIPNKMWNKFRRENPICEQYREALEDLPPEIDRLTASAELNNSLPTQVLEHARECDTCKEAVATFWASRDLFAGPLAPAHERPNAAMNESNPWFSARVMAKIAERESEGRRALTEWSGAVAKLASRLAWVSALVLLLGTTWFYGPNEGRSNTQSVQSRAESTPQYLFDSAAGQASVDDALVSPPER